MRHPSSDFVFMPDDTNKFNLDNAPKNVRERWRERGRRTKDQTVQRLATIDLALERGWEVDEDGTSSPKELLYEAEEFLASHSTELVFDDDQFNSYED